MSSVNKNTRIQDKNTTCKEIIIFGKVGKLEMEKL
jgi:hypothetical protein